jgi:patatin-like phospholipase/acyl hydrolase
VLGLAHGLTPAELHAFYYQKGKRIFDDSWLDDIRDLGGLTGADYDNHHLKEELANIFGDTLLKLLGKKVLIAAFDLDNEATDEAQRHWKPKFFHNFEGSDSDGDTKATDVAVYTSAAPTYFPTADRYIDGGVVANNPSMAALAQTQDVRSVITPHRWRMLPCSLSVQDRHSPTSTGWTWIGDTHNGQGPS